MNDDPPDQLPDDEIRRRMERGLRRALTTPPQQREAAHAIALDRDRTGVDISVDKISATPDYLLWSKDWL